MSNDLVVLHEPEHARFHAIVDGESCVCSYRVDGRVVDFNRTYVPARLEGRGIAAALVKTALDWAAAQRLEVQPSCSYVAAYVRRHPG